MRRVATVSRLVSIGLMLWFPSVQLSSQVLDCIDFETYIGADGNVVSSYDLRLVAPGDYWPPSPALGVRFTLSPSGDWPVIARVGGPPFTGFHVSTPNDYPYCGVGQNDPTYDVPIDALQGPPPKIGCFFLTDFVDIGKDAEDLIIDYSKPVMASYGEILDIDGEEQWTILAFREDLNNPGYIQVGDPLEMGPYGSLKDGDTAIFVMNPGMPFTRLELRYTLDSDRIPGLAFDNFCANYNPDGTGAICGLKFEDIDCDGDLDSGEPPLPGFKIWCTKLPTGVPSFTTTDINGLYCFQDLLPGDYELWEEQKSSWSQSYPPSGIHTVNLTAGAIEEGINFGNCQVGCEHQVRLSEPINAFPGEDVIVDIISDTETDPYLNYPICCVDSFFFSVSYDPTELEFQGATKGTLFDHCDQPPVWEVNTYSLPPNSIVYIEARSITASGADSCCLPELYDTYARLEFKVVDDWDLLCHDIPVSFFWDGDPSYPLAGYQNNTLYSRKPPGPQSLPGGRYNYNYFSSTVHGWYGSGSPPDWRIDLTTLNGPLPSGGGAPNSFLAACPVYCWAQFCLCFRSIRFLNGAIHVVCDDIIAPTVTIEKTHDAIQGQHELVSVTLEDNPVEMGGFDFLIAYDASALSFQAALEGSPYYDPAPDGCGWEYFNYQYGPTGNCGDQCPSGMLRVVGIAETNNGPNHPSCFLPDSLPATLFTLDFLVTNDRTFECQYVPIRFFWADCGDNSISSVDGEVLYVSDHVYDFEGTEITDPTYGFPTYFGVQTGCFNPDPDKPDLCPCPVFINGGIDIICADSIDDRGDINLNGIANEIADAVLFSNYFVYGLSVFNENLEGQVAASDVNGDGLTLSVADLVYLIRIITGDAPPYPKVTPVTAQADVAEGVMSIDLPMGAAHIVVEGNINPTLLATNMEMRYAYDAQQERTRILVYSLEKDQQFEGEFLSGISGDVIAVEMATYEGTPVTAKLVPEHFALHQNYPNPFNATTTITFALPVATEYELVIHNLLGQTVATFAGRSEPGLVEVSWDAGEFASGVYLYRLTAGSFVKTNKMVLLK